MYLLIVSGLSGAGKSVAIKACEDTGFYCVDNLPTALIPTFVDLAVQSQIERVALGIDVRERTFFDGLAEALGALTESGHQIEVLFLEARDDVLIRRYSESRRKHPLATEGTVSQGIEAERELLQHLRHEAHRIVDTSDLNVHELRSIIQAAYLGEERPERMHVFVGSHCTGQKIKIADIVDKYDTLAPLTHSRAASGSRAAPLACLVDLRGCFESDQIHSEKHSWLGVYVFLYESVSDH